MGGVLLISEEVEWIDPSERWWWWWWDWDMPRRLVRKDWQRCAHVFVVWLVFHRNVSFRLWASVGLMTPKCMVGKKGEKKHNNTICPDTTTSSFRCWLLTAANRAALSTTLIIESTACCSNAFIAGPLSSNRENANLHQSRLSPPTAFHILLLQR